MKLALEWSPRVIIFDPRRQFEVGFVTSDVEAMREQMDNPEGSQLIVYQPLSEAEDAEFLEVVQEAYIRGFNSQPSRRFVLLVDEAQDLAKYGESMKALSRFARKTRTDTAALIMTFHRPADVHTDFKSLPTDICLFRTTSPNDLEWIAWAINDEVAEAARRLPDHHYLHVQVDKDTCEVVSDPESWFINIREGETIHA